MKIFMRSLFCSFFLIALVIQSQQTFAADFEEFRSAANFGSFDAKLDGSTLLVRLRIYFEFREGLPDLAPGYAINDYKWNDERKANFKQEVKEQIESVWSEKFKIRSLNNQYLIQIKVLVAEVNREKRAAWKIIAGHYPDDSTDIIVSICDIYQRHYVPSVGCVENDDADKWGTVWMGSHQLNPISISPDLVDPIWVWFDHSTSNLSPGQPDDEFPSPKFLDYILDGVQNHGWWILLKGYGGSTEDQAGTMVGKEFGSIRLARARLKKVKSYLVNKGFDSEKIQLRALGEFHDLDLPAIDQSVVVMNVSQYAMKSQVAHEAGHMFGLPDEATQTASVGPNVSLDLFNELVQKHFVKRIGLVDDDNIMSLGNHVLPRHYIPFIEVMEKILPQRSWKLVVK